MKIRIKKPLRITSAILASALVITTVSGCSLFPKKQVQTAPKVITIWGFESEDLWQPIFKDNEFKKQTNGFEIKYVKKTLTDTFENDALNSILSGQGPDVWAIPNDWVYRHKDKLAVAPEVLVQDKTLNSGFVPAVMENNIIDGKVYAYSPGVDTLMLYYNQAILNKTSEDYAINEPKRSPEESSEVYKTRPDVVQYETSQEIIQNPPKTWSDMIKASNLITKKSGSSIALSGLATGTITNTAYATDIVYSLMQQNGVKMTNGDRSLATFNLPVATASGESEISGKYVIDFYTQFANPSSPNYSWSKDSGNNLDSFAQGKAAYVIATGSAANYFAQKYPNFNFKNALLPQVSSNIDEALNYARFYSYVVPKNSNYPDLAWYIASNAPKNDNTYEDTRTIENYKDKADQIKVFQANTSHIWIKGRYPVEVDQIFRTSVNDVLDGKQSFESAINTAATKVTDLLRKSEW